MRGSNELFFNNFDIYMCVRVWTVVNENIEIRYIVVAYAQEKHLRVGHHRSENNKQNSCDAVFTKIRDQKESCVISFL
jgi:hypothetical protein